MGSVVNEILRYRQIDRQKSSSNDYFSDCLSCILSILSLRIEFKTEQKIKSKVCGVPSLQHIIHFITWILHQIIMYSDKVNLSAG